MPFDYCTAREAFDYGDNAGTGVDPVNQNTVMAKIVTEISRAIDRYCEQAFSLETYTSQVQRGVVDRDGVLTCYPAVPVMSAPTVAEYRAGNSATWLSLSASDADVEEANHGCTVRFLGASYLAIRGQRITIRLSYTGGYADRDALPADLRLCAKGLASYEFLRRTAPQDRTAIPELGVVITPGYWPANIRRTLNNFKKVA